MRWCLVVRVPDGEEEGCEEVDPEVDDHHQREHVDSTVTLLQGD